jgi:hypothetical protein
MRTKKSKEERLAEQRESKLTRAITGAGLSWTVFASMVEMGDNIDGFPVSTASWYFNRKTRKEVIIVNPELIDKLTVKLLQIVIKHEIIHKSIHRNLVGQVSNHELLNCALDAEANKILYYSHPKDMFKLCNIMYLEENRKNILAINNCSINHDESVLLPAGIREIFEDLYRGRKDDLPCDHPEYTTNNYIPDPLVLYYKLSAVLGQKEKEEIKKKYSKCGGIPNEEKSEIADKLPLGGEEGFRNDSEETMKIEVESVKKFFKKEHSNSVSKILQEYIYEPMEISTRGLQDFIKSWHTMKQVEKIEEDIYATVRSDVSMDPYPDHLSRTGMEYIALGVSGPDALPLYINDSIGATEQKKICCYFDISGSMTDDVPYMVHIANFLDNLPECCLAGGEFGGRYIFGGKVEGMSQAKWERFKTGKCNTSFTTHFSSVIKHALTMISESEVDIIVILTDGLSNVGNNLIEKFNKTNKKCYPIYFGKKDLIKSNLDELNGKSFTINTNVTSL